MKTGGLLTAALYASSLNECNKEKNRYHNVLARKNFIKKKPLFKFQIFL